MSTVIDNLTWTHRSTSLKIVDTYTVTTTSDVVSLNAIFTKCVYSRLSDFMLRKLSYEISIVSVVGTAYSYISFATKRVLPGVDNLNIISPSVTIFAIIKYFY